MPGDDWQKFANTRALLSYMLAHPGKKLHFMGMEFGQWGEWNHDVGLDWHLLDPQSGGSAAHGGLQLLVTDLNALYQDEPALHTIDFDWAGFEWLQVNDAANCVLAFLRRGREPENQIVVVCNWTPVVRQDYWVRVPRGGFYREIFNSDAAIYGGSNVGNGGVPTEQGGDGEAYLRLSLPPLGVLMFKQAVQPIGYIAAGRRRI
jgi:1,4-alpha-glucan branching enzyme